MSQRRPAGPSPLICAAGDLVDDIVVHLHGAPVRDGDVPATVTRHRGGSAANTAAVVARLGGRARFVGQVGRDPAGALLVDDLTALGVECAVRRAGVTGTVVVVVEPDGSRTMYSDRRAAGGDAPIDERVVDDVDVLHVPYFGLAGAAAAAPIPRLVARARPAGAVLSLDPSSVALCGAAFLDLVREARPDVVLCNEAEAATLGVDEAGLPGARLVVVKQGPAPALLRGEVSAEVPVPGHPAVVDTTGAGDAFAGGFLLALARREGPVAAAHAGHAAAARVIAGAGADAWCDPDPGAVT